MTSISSTGSGLLDRIAASRTATTYRAPFSTTQARQDHTTMNAARTRVTLDAGADDGLVYGLPKTPGLGAQRVWAKAGDDGLSELMARNSGKDAHTLSDRWRGLGGMLLKQLADTGAGYKQTLADYVPPPGEAGAVDATASTDPVAAAAALKDEAVGGVATNAATVNLKIQTRSGQTVELKIDVNNGDNGGTRGLQVEVSSSGTLSGTERQALAELADGLDEALEGLGEGLPTLDLSKLAAFDKSGVLSQLDLKIENPNAPANVPGVMKSFSMHLGADKKSLALQTTSGEMSMEVDAATPLGASNGAQRRSAIDQLLKQIDDATERSHADAGMTKAFKDAFKALQAPPSDTKDNAADAAGDAKKKAIASLVVQPLKTPAQDGDPTDPATSAVASMSEGLRSQAQAMQSGLADFQASFSADSQRTSRIGSVKEQGHAEYKIGQTTTTRPNSATGGLSIQQSQTEDLTASFQRSRSFTLDRDSGNYDATTVQDSKTVTTLIDTVKDSIARAMRKTDEHKLKTFTSLEKNRVTEHQEWPQQQSFMERLR
ncbi:hypothetical protein [Mitsuaria sp. GD03876]|uniref:hypothetical protein n=1 Tax=Mitsuaria sp. GD03876 TaxID=2975399 RepID=UPI0024489F6C|nr:hypothetical protein [Mitsuaria sp. GD03876]MDH0867535.1 hypothetical protein [Mitsuaria sp. GD03876]